MARSLGLLNEGATCDAPPRRVLELDAADTCSDDPAALTRVLSFGLHAAAASGRAWLAPRHVTLQGRRVPLHRMVKLPYDDAAQAAVLPPTHYEHVARDCGGRHTPQGPKPEVLSIDTGSALVTAARASTAERLVVRVPSDLPLYMHALRGALRTCPAVLGGFASYHTGVPAGSFCQNECNVN